MRRKEGRLVDGLWNRKWDVVIHVTSTKHRRRTLLSRHSRQKKNSGENIKSLCVSSIQSYYPPKTNPFVAAKLVMLFINNVYCFAQRTRGCRDNVYNNDSPTKGEQNSAIRWSNAVFTTGLDRLRRLTFNSASYLYPTWSPVNKSQRRTDWLYCGESRSQGMPVNHEWMMQWLTVLLDAGVLIHNINIKLL